jgi:hypothetical protein
MMTASPGADPFATSKSPLPASLHRAIEGEARGARSSAADKRGTAADPKSITVVGGWLALVRWQTAHSMGDEGQS